MNPHVIKTAEQLMNALTCLSVYTVGAACYMSDVKNRLFVIEEIDCTAWKDIVKPRTSGGGGEEPPPALMVPSPFAPLEDVKKMMMEEKEQKFTLSDLLEILDGMIESDGRMIVFTTNHPENLDPALLRPGRIDMIVEFTNMTRKNVRDMYQVWFDKKPPKDVYHAMKVRGTVCSWFAVLTKNYTGLHLFPSRNRTAVFDFGHGSDPRDSLVILESRPSVKMKRPHGPRTNVLNLPRTGRQ